MFRFFFFLVNYNIKKSPSCPTQFSIHCFRILYFELSLLALYMLVGDFNVHNTNLLKRATELNINHE